MPERERRTLGARPHASTRRYRWIWGPIVVTAWLVWAFYVDHQLAVMGQERLTEEHGSLAHRQRTIGMYLAWFLFWPPVIGLWLIRFPGDRHRVPWYRGQRIETPPRPQLSADEVARTLRNLVVRTTDRVPAKDRAVVLEFIEANEPEKALEHLALRLVEDDQPVSKDEGAEMEKLDRVLQLSRRGSWAVSFAAAGLSGPFR